MSTLSLKGLIALYSARNIFSYPMWVITITSHANTTPSLCPVGLQGQTNKPALWGQTNSQPRARDQL